MKAVMKCTAMLVAVMLLGSLVLGAGLQLAATLTPAPPVVCQVTDQASWQQAVQTSWKRDVVINLEGTIPWTGSYWDFRLGRPGGTVDINGGEVDLSAYQSAWPAAYDNNGLVLTGRRATLRGVSVRGYEGTGSALRADVSDSLEVLDSRFADIGTRVMGVRPDGTPGYTNAIGVHSRPRRVLVLGSTFEACARNDEQLAHVLYVGAWQSILVARNSYIKCGSIWGANSPDTVITGETVDAGAEALVWNRRTQEFQHPWLLVHNSGRLTFAGNTIAGRVDHVFHGRLPASSVIEGNSYRCQAGYWFLEWGGTQPERSLDWWKGQGFDR